MTGEVYMVTSVYGDSYLVDWIFERKEDADAYVQEWGEKHPDERDCTPSVEGPMTLFRAGERPEWKAELHMGYVATHKGAQHAPSGPWSNTEWHDVEPGYGPPLGDGCSISRDDNPDSWNGPQFSVSGFDHERVRKVYSEELAAFKLRHNLP